MIKSLKAEDGSGAVSILQGPTSMVGLIISQPNGDAACVTLTHEEVTALIQALSTTR